MERSKQGVENSLTYSLLFWLHVGVDLNISEKENVLDCVSLKQSASNTVLRQVLINIGKH